MDAQIVYQSWRKILRSPSLQRRMFESGAPLEDEFQLSPQEAEAVRAYATKENAVRMSAINYRFRMVSSFGNALETAAPLTYRALRGADTDLRAIAVPFLDAIGWYDYGPYVFTYCAKILDWLAEHAATERPEGLRGLMELERVAGNIVRRCSGQNAEPSVSSAMAVDLDNCVWEATDRGEVVRTRHDMGPWLRQMNSLGKTDLPLKDCTYLISLPDLTRSPQISTLPSLGAALLAVLRNGASEVADVSRKLALRGFDAEPAALSCLLAQLAVRGVVRQRA